MTTGGQKPEIRDQRSEVRGQRALGGRVGRERHRRVPDRHGREIHEADPGGG
jgi:hypothetical protein